jgi:hypothetical protein
MHARQWQTDHRAMGGLVAHSPRQSRSRSADHFGSIRSRSPTAGGAPRHGRMHGAGSVPPPPVLQLGEAGTAASVATTYRGAADIEEDSPMRSPMAAAFPEPLPPPPPHDEDDDDEPPPMAAHAMLQRTESWSEDVVIS